MEVKKIRIGKKVIVIECPNIKKSYKEEVNGHIVIYLRVDP